MIDINSIIELPDDDGWRVINIKSIKKFANTYTVQLLFQRVPDAFKLWRKKKFRELSFFSKEDTYSLRINVAYVRLFPIGSIWFRQGKYRVILPCYFGRYKLQESILTGSNLIRSHIDKYLQDYNLPKSKIKSDTYSWIVSYELERPVYHNKKEKGIVSLNTVPAWNDAHETHFVAFYSAEIYRYFFTGSGISDINERMLYPAKPSPSNPYSLYHLPSERELDNLHYEATFPVFMKKKEDIDSIEQIGNFIYLDEYQNGLQSLRAEILLKEYDSMKGISRIPFSDFTQLSFCAHRVKRKDGKKGLLIMLLDSFEGYRSIKYTPILPEKDNDYKSGNSGSLPLNGNQSGGNQENEVPGYNADGSASNDSDNEEINIMGIESLLRMNSSIQDRNPFKYKLNGEGGLAVIIQSDGDVRPPGANPNPGGKKVRVGRWVNLFNYFDIFTDIVSNITMSKEFSANNLQVRSSYLNADFQKVPNKFEVDLDEIKSIVNPKKKKFKLYIVIIELVKRRKFYLFEKVRLDKNGKKIPTQSRTWLYSSSSGNYLTDEAIAKLIRVHVGILKISNNQRELMKSKAKVSHGFNHKHEKKVQKGENDIIVSITVEEAKKDHSSRIVGAILKTLIT